MYETLAVAVVNAVWPGLRLGAALKSFATLRHEKLQYIELMMSSSKMSFFPPWRFRWRDRLFINSQLDLETTQHGPDLENQAGRYNRSVGQHSNTFLLHECLWLNVIWCHCLRHGDCEAQNASYCKHQKRSSLHRKVPCLSVTQCALFIRCSCLLARIPRTAPVDESIHPNFGHGNRVFWCIVTVLWCACADMGLWLEINDSVRP